MFRDKSMFNYLNEYMGGNVTFEDGNHARIKGGVQSKSKEFWRFERYFM